jgi:fluoride exporter
VSLWVWLAVAAVGAGGACLRYLIDRIIVARNPATFPIGTLTVNLSGSLLLGVITGLALYHAFPATPKLLLGSALLGAYTTFSTFALESVMLTREGERLEALVNVCATVVGGCLAAAAGLALASL